MLRTSTQNTLLIMSQFCFFIFILYFVSTKFQNTFYIFDKNENWNLPINETNVVSIQNAWNLIVSSMIASISSFNKSDSNQFIDLNIIKSSDIIIPSLFNPNDIPITFNIICPQTIPCNLKIVNTNFITIMDENLNSTKLILYLHSFVAKPISAENVVVLYIMLIKRK